SLEDVEDLSERGAGWKPHIRSISSLAMRTDVRFPARTSLAQILDVLERDSDFLSQVTHWERLPAKAPRYAPFPEWLDPRIARSLRARSIEALYSHQAAALEAAHAKKHVVVVTPTASG